MYGFDAGLFHPLLNPAHLVVLVALGLLLGQQGAKHWRGACLGFIATLLLGTWLGNTYGQLLPLANMLVLLGIAVIVGLLCVLAFSLPPWLTGLCSLLAGWVLGLDTIPLVLPGISAHKITLTLAGAMVSSSLLLLTFCLCGWLLHKLWAGIAVRVLGSWVTASAILTLALPFARKT